MAGLHYKFQRDTMHRTVKKAADKILYKRKRNKGKEFKNISY